MRGMLLWVGEWDSRGLSVFPGMNYVNECLLLGICAEAYFVVWRTAVYYIRQCGDWYFNAPDV